MLTLEWHRTPEYGYASKIVSSQPMFKHNTMKFDIDHAVSVLNGVAGRDGATPTAKPKAKAKGKAKGKAKAQMKPQQQAKVTRAAIIQRVRKKLALFEYVIDDHEHDGNDDNDVEDGSETLEAQLERVLESYDEDYVV